VYTYDNRNQLVSAAESVTDGGTVTARVTYVYDAFGNKIERDYWNGTTTTTERYGLDGWNPAKPTPVGIENFDDVLDLDGTNALTERRLFGPGTDELTLREDGSGTVGWYLTDHLGNVRGITDGSGAPLTTISYDGWGNVLSNSTSAQSDRYLKGASQYDSVLGLWQNDVRFTNGKFWNQEDPKGFDAGDANLRRVVGNAPTIATDPSGLDDKAEPKKVEKERPTIELYDITEKGTDETNKLRNANGIKLPNGGEAKINVYTKAKWEIPDAKEAGIEKPIIVTNAIVIRVTATKGMLPYNTHFLQIASVIKYDKAGKTIAGYVPTEAEGQDFWIQLTDKPEDPKWFVDTARQPQEKLDIAPWYDGLAFKDSFDRYRSSPTELTIVDRPNHTFRTGAVKSVMTFQSLLVVDGKIVYSVVWKSIAEKGMPMSYEVVSGDLMKEEESNKFGKQEKLHKGYADDAHTKPLEFKNPVKESPKK
jgi:hypothetical protein